MAVVIEMPRLSDTMKEGTIVSWLKKEGEEIESGQLLAEVEGPQRLQCGGALSAQCPECRPGLLIQKHRIGLLRLDHRLLPVLMDRRLGATQHAGAHLHSLGTHRESGGHRGAVANAAGSDNRDISARTN